MRLSVFASGTVSAGLAVAVGGALAAAHRPLTALALFGAAALAAELLEEPETTRVRAPVESGVVRVASGVDLAAVIVLGPWQGALVAGSAALLARLVRGTWRQAAFQASAYALASFAAGYAFALGGGRTGHLAVPDDLVPLTVLALVYLLVSRCECGDSDCHLPVHMPLVEAQEIFDAPDARLVASLHATSPTPRRPGQAEPAPSPGSMR